MSVGADGYVTNQIGARMTMIPTPTASLAVNHNSSKPSGLQFAQQDVTKPEGRPQRKMPLMRTYEVAYLTKSGSIEEFSQIAPALPAFEQAFCAFARGTLIQTKLGPVAVEDLLPGDMIQTGKDEAQPLIWRGSMTVIPARDPFGEPAQGSKNRLTRISMDTFGLGRPMPDLVLGPHTRIVHRIATIRRLTGHSTALIPATDFLDGVNIIETSPMTPVQVYHIALPKQAKIIVNGVETASQHPGMPEMHNLRGDMLNLYLSLFPHAKSLDDFGPIAMPYLSLRDLELIDAA